MRKFIVVLISSMFLAAPSYAGTGHDHGDSHRDKESSGHKKEHSHSGSDDHHKSKGHADDHGKSHGHSHGPIDKMAAVEKATNKIKQLASTGKIDKSWTAVSMTSAEKKTLKNGPEWLVTFNNKTVGDKSKQTLYVFYTLDGKYLATNYTGK